AASSKSDQAAIERVHAEHGADGFLAAWLRHRGVDWAADLIPGLPNLVPGPPSGPEDEQAIGISSQAGPQDEFSIDEEFSQEEIDLSPFPNCTVSRVSRCSPWRLRRRLRRCSPHPHTPFSAGSAASSMIRPIM